MIVRKSQAGRWQKIPPEKRLQYQITAAIKLLKANGYTVTKKEKKP